MSILIIFSVLFLWILIYYYYKNVYLFDKKLKRFPNPPGLAILGNALDFMSEKGNLAVLRNYVDTYGDTVLLKIGPNRRILVSSNYNIFKILADDGDILKRPEEYDVFHRWVHMGLAAVDGHQWKKQRRIINPMFNYNSLTTFLEVFESNAKILVEQFAKHLDKNSVDVLEMSNFCTLDIICETSMGTSVKAQENSNSAYVQSVKRILNIIFERFSSSYKIFDLLYYFTEDYKLELKAVEILNSLPESMLENRRNHLNYNQKTKVFLDRLLDATDNGEKLTLEEVVHNVNSFMFAGHDSTGAAVSFILFCLGNHLEIQLKVFEEQQQIFGDDLESNATFQNLKDMKYLEIVIKESLRLYSPVAYVVKELTEDREYEGTVLPEGLVIVFFIHALHRNSNYFSHPDKFIPERFENNDGKTPFAFLPFGSGPRNCIGEKYAMLQMKTLISRVVRNFEILPSIPTHELKLESYMVLTSTNGICVRFKKRKVFV